MKKLFSTLVSTLLVASLLSACGWHLRGSMDIGLDLDNVYVSAEDTHGSLVNLLKRTLIANNVTVVPQPEQADYRIFLSNEEQNRRTVSVGNEALAAEYELILEVDYRIENQAGEPLVPQATATGIRSYTFDPNAVAAKAEEERLILDELRYNLVEQILRRLRFVSQQTAETDSSATETVDTDAQAAP